jgi:hypothetical protein
VTLSNDPFGDLLEQLQQTDLEFIVCGGMAAIIHGVERTTLDLDLSVSLTPANVPKLVQAVEHLGLRPRVPVNPAILANGEEVDRMIQEKHAVVFTFIDPANPFFQLDIFLLPELRYEKLAPFSEVHTFRGNPLRVLTAQKLLELKEAIEPPRPKDQMDIQILRQLLHDNA